MDFVEAGLDEGDKMRGPALIKGDEPKQIRTHKARVVKTFKGVQVMPSFAQTTKRISPVPLKRDGWIGPLPDMGSPVAKFDGRDIFNKR